MLQVARRPGGGFIDFSSGDKDCTAGNVQKVRNSSTKLCHVRQLLEIT